MNKSQMKNFSSHAITASNSADLDKENGVDK